MTKYNKSNFSSQHTSKTMSKIHKIAPDGKQLDPLLNPHKAFSQ